jgi:hypothetical protein
MTAVIANRNGVGASGIVMQASSSSCDVVQLHAIRGVAIGAGVMFIRHSLKS